MLTYYTHHHACFKINKGIFLCFKLIEYRWRENMGEKSSENEIIEKIYLYETK
jgi:hypothetical protein